MATVSINPPKTPVTKGSDGVATATVPNVCKMPGPPAPFVPTPLPNIGRSSISPKGYSKRVKIEGKPVAIRGASFGSMGDTASKGTGGGLISSNVEGPTKFIGPGSMNVTIEGKNVQLLGDPMLNNCGPSGTPANAATLMGVIQPTGLVVAVEAGRCPVCGEDHKDLAETAESKADAKDLADAYRKRVSGISRGVQTMLGVVRCKCGKRYAGQSSFTRKELHDAAKACGMIPPPSIPPSLKEMDGKSRDDAAELAEASAREAGKKVMATVREGLSKKNQQLFDRALRKSKRMSAASLKNKDNLRYPAAYPAGSCAAQSVLAFMQSEGGLPEAMTEQWFGRSQPTAGSIRYIDDESGQRRLDTRAFRDGETVPPCRSCVLLVPLILCFRKKAKQCECKS